MIHGRVSFVTGKEVGIICYINIIYARTCHVYVHFIHGIIWYIEKSVCLHSNWLANYFNVQMIHGINLYMV